MWITVVRDWPSYPTHFNGSTTMATEYNRTPKTFGAVASTGETLTGRFFPVGRHQWEVLLLIDGSESDWMRGNRFDGRKATPEEYFAAIVHEYETEY